ncbi:bifunctional peptidase and arginyl-hydroxylase JMJD5-like [Dysidea avara]|uniref:bifunctional peptidase and arginyl-hydroxylase JMJD5-like n=1 Tax=Dysidea avara TaxID=196820 RepID=UPI0033272034
MLRIAFVLLTTLAVFVRNEDNLPGHMQPIGSHRPPEEGIEVLTSVPDPLEFYDKYMAKHTPVLFKGAIAGTPAVTSWNDDEYLSKTFGNLKIGYEIGKKEDRMGNGSSSTFGEFLKRYKTEDIYLVDDMPDGMQQEWMVPRCLLCGGYIEYLNFCFMWFSNGGTMSVLHTDSYENLHCLASGIKEFVLIPAEYSEIIGPEHAGLGYYHIDVERVNMTSHPGMMEVPWYYVRVEPGDCLYLPYNWIHHVSSHGRNLGVNIWWSWFDFIRDKCPEDMSEVPDFLPLAQFQLRPEKQIVSVFVDIAREDGYVYAEDLATVLSMYNYSILHQILERLDPGCDGKMLVSKLTRDEIPQENYNKLKEFVDSLESSNKDGEEAPEGPEELYDGPMEEWPEDKGGEFDWSNGREKFSIGHQVDIGEDDDDIQVPSEEDIVKFHRQYSGKKTSTEHNEL